MGKKTTVTINQDLSLFTFTIFSNYHYHITHEFSSPSKLNFLGNIKQLNSVECGGIHLNPDTQKRERQLQSFQDNVAKKINNVSQKNK